VNISKNEITLYLFIAGSFALLLILLFGVNYALRGGANVKFVVSPKRVSYSIGDKKYTGDQTIYLSSGHYNIVFSQDLFISKTTSFDVANNKTQTVEVALDADTTTITYDKLSTEDLYDVEYAMETKSQEKLDKLVKDYPILANLPYYKSNYRIDINYANQDSKPNILITLVLAGDSSKRDTYAKEAEEWLLATDKDYNKLQIEYTVE